MGDCGRFIAFQATDRADYEVSALEV